MPRPVHTQTPPPVIRHPPKPNLPPENLKQHHHHDSLDQIDYQMGDRALLNLTDGTDAKTYVLALY
jgi:hypothetical protein